MKLSIVIPCFNEEKTISKVIDKILKLSEIDKEIIIINDGSTDNTRKILDDLKNRSQIISIHNHDKNEGKGAALKQDLENQMVI